MKIKLVAVVALALAGSGCVTIAERRAFDEESCRGYGFRAGSEGFANCLLQIDLERSASRRAWIERDVGGPYFGFGYGYGFRRW
jgi:hypothetical protein